MSTFAVIGGGGTVGRHIVETLSAAGEAIAAVARDPEPGGTVTVAGPEQHDVSQLVWRDTHPPRSAGGRAAAGRAGYLTGSGEGTIRM
jgi:nucleoside-diphosphate-sugar epimerase